MAWSTSQLADLAGTTLKAVRHYHRIGLLDEPRRLANGYKQYEVAHLLRLLQIKRLADLGVPLSQIASMARADEEPDEALRVLDAELEATIERLQRIRGELAVILRHRAPVELPEGFGEIAGKLGPSDQSLVMIYSRVFDDATMDEIRRMIRDEPRSAADDALDALAPDASREARHRLAVELAPEIQGQVDRYPWMRDPAAGGTHRPAFVESTVVQALAELYNRAQLDVLFRAHLIMTEQLEALETLDAASGDGALSPIRRHED